jgi:hypothetical protein
MRKQKRAKRTSPVRKRAKQTSAPTLPARKSTSSCVTALTPVLYVFRVILKTKEKPRNLYADPFSYSYLSANPLPPEFVTEFGVATSFAAAREAAMLIDSSREVVLVERLGKAWSAP